MEFTIITEAVQPKEERHCVNCRHNIRTGEFGFSECHCEIDGHYIGYVQCFEGWCRRYAKERNRR